MTGKVEFGVNMAPPLQWSVIYLAMYVMNAAFFLASVTAAVLRRETAVNWIVATQFALAVLFEILSSISYTIANDHRECFSILLWIPADFAFASCLILFESQLVKNLLIYTVLGFITCSIRGALYVFDPLHSLSRVLQSIVTLALLLACTIQVFRWRALSHARRLVCKDQASYSVVWAALIAQQQNLVCLGNLKRDVKHLQSGLTSLPPKQISKYIPGPSKLQDSFLQQTIRSFKLPLYLCVAPRTAGSQSVDNLDQIYVQATCLNPVLINKTKEWAGLSKGLFRTSNWHGTKLWKSSEEMELESKTQSHITSNWCNIKAVHRAIEKAVRSYGQVL